MTAPFVAELSRRLHGRSTALALPLTWVEQHLGESHQTIEQLVKFEAQAQAAAQVSVSNSIGSLRLLASMDWREFVETLSKVEQDAAPRSGRRLSAHGLRHPRQLPPRGRAHRPPQRRRRGRGGERRGAAGARRGGAAAIAQPIARMSATTSSTPGQAQLERAVAMRAPLAHRMRRTVARRPLAWFAGAILTTTLLLALLPLAIASQGFAAPLAALPVGAWWSRRSPSPRCCCRRASSRWPSSTGSRRCWRSRGRCRAWTSRSASRTPRARWWWCRRCCRARQGIDALAEALEVRFLANRDAHLHFALLTDFLDAPAETLPGDEALLAHARECIEALNRRYAAAGEKPRVGDRFFLFHRPRRWNAARARLDGPRAQARQAGRPERAAARRAGHERFSLDRRRHRGAARRALRHHARHRHAAAARRGAQVRRDDGAPAQPPAPRRPAGGAARRRRPRHPAAARRRQPARRRAARATRGCSAATPASTPTRAPSATSTRTCSARARSSARASTTSMRSSRCSAVGCRENRVLSHDLLEGGYARSGLISDVELVEESPARYDADVKRRHRWMRGDWQIAAWLLPRVPTALRAADGERKRVARGQSAVGAVAAEDPRQPAAQPRAGVR